MDASNSTIDTHRLGEWICFNGHDELRPLPQSLPISPKPLEASSAVVPYAESRPDALLDDITLRFAQDRTSIDISEP